MLEEHLKRVFALCFVVFLTSCQTVEKTNILYFKGYFNVEQAQNKQSYPVEIYTDSTRPVLLINLLTPFGGVFATYLWDSRTHQILLPSRKQYFKQPKWPSNFPFQGIIQNPLWFYQALLQQTPDGWNCEETKKCSKNSSIIEWEKKFFRKNQIRIRLEKEGFSAKIREYKSPSRFSWDIEIPKDFQQIDKMDFTQ
ncbi:MAG: hypothetical protein OXK80_04625 [Bdellovibrionales bacterium]|nr:hypothetical protein [Bdellovibrionales bacterium]